MRMTAIFNRDSGTLRTMDLDAFCKEAKAIFAEEGHELTCTVVEGSEVLDAIKRAAAEPETEAIIAAGGDGTISSAAGLVHDAGKVLGVLPAGTMNLFARALSIPSDINQALRVVAQGQVSRIDLATANRQPFVHQFGVGIHARLVRIRSDMVYNSRFGKMLASLRAVAAAALDPPRFKVEYDDEGGRQSRFVSGIAVSNNPLDDTPVPVAQRLDSGQLGVYFAAPVSTGEMLRLFVDVLLGRWRANPQVTELETDRIVLHFPKRKREVHAVIDGELIELEREVDLEILPQALQVIVPTIAAEPVAGS